MTGVGSGCDMDGFCTYLELVGKNHEHCSTPCLDSVGAENDDFEQGMSVFVPHLYLIQSPIYRMVKKSILNMFFLSFSGATDFFQNNALGECASMDFPDGLFQFTVYHDSADDWCMHSIKLKLADNPLVGCTPGVRLENGQHFVCDV